MSQTILSRIRMTALVIGCLSLVAAMLLFPEERTPRDWLWSIGVAALVFTLVVNWVMRREAKREKERGPSR